MSTSICWELTCDGLASGPGGVKDSHPLNTTESGDERWLHGHVARKGFGFLALSNKTDPKNFALFPHYFSFFFRTLPDAL